MHVISKPRRKSPEEQAQYTRELLAAIERLGPLRLAAQEPTRLRNKRIRDRKLSRKQETAYDQNGTDQTDSAREP